MINRPALSQSKFAHDPTPVYFKLQKILLEQIESGQWEPGARISPERELARMYAVSIGTVKKAVLNLVQQGLLYRIQGKGTFVAGTTLKRESLRYYRLRRNLLDDEAVLKIKFIELSKRGGFHPANRQLGLRLKENLYEVKRMFFTGRKPVIYSISYLPQKMFKDLKDLTPSNFERDTLYHTLEKRYNLPTISNHELFGAIPANREIAKMLQVPVGTALLQIEMLSFTYRQQPYEYRLSYCVTHERKVYAEI